MREGMQGQVVELKPGAGRAASGAASPAPRGARRANAEAKGRAEPRAPARAEQPLVTVIIPTYNRPLLLPRAIQSVRRQTHRNLEILIVDDGSADDIGAVVAAIGDDRIRYIRHETNKGLPAVRNTGIRAARGDYIAFLDDDDEWREHKIEKQLQAMEDYDAVACTALVNGFVLRVHKRRDVTLRDLKKGGFAPSGLLAKAFVLRDVLFDESLRQGEDWDGFIRIAQRYSIGFVAEPLLIYHEGAHPSMTNEAKRMAVPELEKRTAVLHKHREFLGEKWFRYHMADALLSYFGGRSDKWRSLGYAVKRCGVAPAAAVLAARLRRRLRRVILTGKWR